MDENEFEFEGRAYRPIKTGAPCSARALCNKSGCLYAPCAGDIIFVERHQ